MRGRTPIADFYDLVNSLRPLSLPLSIPLKNAVRALPGGCSVPVVLSQILWTFSASRPFLALSWIAIPRLDGIYLEGTSIAAHALRCGIWHFASRALRAREE